MFTGSIRDISSSYRPLCTGVARACGLPSRPGMASRSARAVQKRKAAVALQFAKLAASCRAERAVGGQAALRAEGAALSKRAVFTLTSVVVSPQFSRRSKCNLRLSAYPKFKRADDHIACARNAANRFSISSPAAGSTMVPTPVPGWAY